MSIRAVPFLEGDHVAHVMYGDGVVSHVEMDRVTVTYETGHAFTIAVAIILEARYQRRHHAYRDWSRLGWLSEMRRRGYLWQWCGQNV